MKIVAVLYSGGEIAKRTPALLGSAENARTKGISRRKRTRICRINR
jgi:hypothetical protein